MEPLGPDCWTIQQVAQYLGIRQSTARVRRTPEDASTERVVPAAPLFGGAPPSRSGGAPTSKRQADLVTCTGMRFSGSGRTQRAVPSGARVVADSVTSWSCVWGFGGEQLLPSHICMAVRRESYVELFLKNSLGVAQLGWPGGSQVVGVDLGGGAPHLDVGDQLGRNRGVSLGCSGRRVTSMAVMRTWLARSLTNRDRARRVWSPLRVGGDAVRECPAATGTAPAVTRPTWSIRESMTAA